MAKRFGPVRDQNGVVWMENMILSREYYEKFIKGAELPTYEDLPFWDSHDQNIVEVD